MQALQLVAAFCQRIEKAGLLEQAGSFEISVFPCSAPPD
jgi:hypothetical protein